MNELMKMEENKIYTSIEMNDEDSKKKMYNFSTARYDLLSDIVNKEFYIKDYYVEIMNIIDNDTGELKMIPKIILDTDIGIYSCSSYGIFKNFQKICGIFNLDEIRNIKFKVTKTNRDKKSYLNLTLA